MTHEATVASAAPCVWMAGALARCTDRTTTAGGNPQHRPRRSAWSLAKHTTFLFAAGRSFRDAEGSASLPVYAGLQLTF